jgi:hypothetical protein
MVITELRQSNPKMRMKKRSLHGGKPRPCENERDGLEPSTSASWAISDHSPESRSDSQVMAGSTLQKRW